jgi:hypothetical protein
MTPSLVLGICLLAVGCDITGPEPGEFVDALMVHVELIPAGIDAGEPTAVVIRVRNVTSRTIVLEDRGCRTLDFVVYDSALANIVYPAAEPMGCIPRLYDEIPWEFDRRLEPDETATMVHYYETHEFFGTTEPIGGPLPPGQYDVRGGVPGDEPGELRVWDATTLRLY